MLVAVTVDTLVTLILEAVAVEREPSVVMQRQIIKQVLVVMELAHILLGDQ
jgi:hypothetical protein